MHRAAPVSEPADLRPRHVAAHAALRPKRRIVAPVASVTPGASAPPPPARRARRRRSRCAPPLVAPCARRRVRRAPSARGFAAARAIVWRRRAIRSRRRTGGRRAAPFVPPPVIAASRAAPCARLVVLPSPVARPAPPASLAPAPRTDGGRNRRGSVFFCSCFSAFPSIASQRAWNGSCPVPCALRRTAPG